MNLVATLIANPLSRDLSPELAQMASAAIPGSSTEWLSKGAACDLNLPDRSDPSEVHNALAAALQGQSIDFAVQEATGRRKQVLIADMDSTMIDQECIDELAAEIGIKDKVSAITAKAMNGEIDFEDAVDERVSLLQGLDATVTDKIIQNRITLAAGGKTLVATMRASGAYTALVSGGFTTFTSRIAKMLRFHEDRANILEESDGKLTGKVRRPILGAEAKVDALNDIASARGLTSSDFIAVGDGANDLPMLKLAGTGVALHAKPNVAAQAKISIVHGDLTSLLYLQGYREDEFARP